MDRISITLSNRIVSILFISKLVQEFDTFRKAIINYFCVHQFSDHFVRNYFYYFLEYWIFLFLYTITDRFFSLPYYIFFIGLMLYLYYKRRRLFWEVGSWTFFLYKVFDFSSKKFWLFKHLNFFFSGIYLNRALIPLPIYIIFIRLKFSLTNEFLRKIL